MCTHVQEFLIPGSCWPFTNFQDHPRRDKDFVHRFSWSANVADSRILSVSHVDSITHLWHMDFLFWPNPSSKAMGSIKYWRWYCHWQHLVCTKQQLFLSKYGVFSVLKLQHWPMIHIAKALECILHNLDTSFRFEPQENHLQHKSKTILDSYARLKPLQLGVPSRTTEGHRCNGKTWQNARC